MVNKNQVVFSLLLLVAGYVYGSESTKLLKIESDRWHADQKRLNQAIYESYPLLKEKYTTLSPQEKGRYLNQLNEFHASPLFARYQIINNNLMMMKAFQPSQQERK